MAQGPHDHQNIASSNKHSFVLPLTTTFPGPAQNNNSGSRIGSPVGMDVNKGKEVVPNCIQGGEGGSASGGGAKTNKGEGKQLAKPATDIAGDDFHKGKGSLPADDGNLSVNIIMQRERRKQMKGMIKTLHELMPHVPEKVKMATLVGETIDFIRVLEQTKGHLEKQKQEQALMRQATASSSSVTQTAQGIAAMSDGWGPVPPHRPTASAAGAAPAGAAATGPVEFQTWATPNVVLSVLNHEAIINVRVPRQPRMLSLVLSVLNKYGINVVSMQVAADGAGSFFTIHTHMNGSGGGNPSVEDIYKLAASEIPVRLPS